MESFCGGEPLWNSTLTWSNKATYPDFTECFQNTVLIWISSGWLFLTVPAYLPILLTHPKHPIPNGWKNLSKMCLAVLQLVIVLIELVYGGRGQQEGDRQFWRADFVGPLIEGVTLLLVLVYLELERRKGFITSGVLFFYWLVALITYIIPVYRKIIQKEYETFPLGFGVFFVYFGLTLMQFVLSCIAETSPQQDNTAKQPCPETQASFISRLTFHWINGFVRQGFRQTLTEDDMFELHPRDKSRDAVQRFEEVWRAEEIRQSKRAKSTTSKVYVNASGDSASETTPLLGSGHVNYSSEDIQASLGTTSKPQVSLLLMLWRTFGWEVTTLQIWKLIYDVLMFANPFLLQLLITFTEDLTQPDWKGYIYAAAFLATILIQTLSFHATTFQAQTASLRIRAALIASIFKKALRMNNQARTESTTGEIVNLMSVDTEHISFFTTYIFFIWSGPLQIIGCLIFLYYTVGYAMFSGLAVLVILFPLNAVVTAKVQKLQDQMMAQKDKRIKLMTEILNGIKILKLYAWEMAFGKKITDIRTEELRLLRREALINMTLSFSWTLSACLVALATFGTYIYIEPDHRIDAQTAFVAMTLFNILKFAVIVAPIVVMELIKAIVSVRRISKYLNTDDLDMACVTHAPSTVDAVEVVNGSFAWNPEQGLTLKKINLNIPKGSLVAVVGTVGTGKSSLLSAILGEMEKLEGSVNVDGTVAYVPQQAWIQNATLKDNILFSNSMEKDRYKAVINACSLTADLDLLAAKDMTEIGEKGINLSGGQKQRVSLARAVYFDCDIYLLDDPLSAVDSHVGKHIFQHVIGQDGLLAKKTRVLVTHGIQWLPSVDFIVVINNGTVSEVGTYEELMEHDGAFASFLRTYLTSVEDSDSEDEDEEVKAIKAAALQRLVSRESASDSAGDQHHKKEPVIDVQGTRQRTVSRNLTRTVSQKDSPEKTKKLKEDQSTVGGSKLIEEEELETGNVRWSVVKAYCRAVGYRYTVLMFLLYGVYEGFNVVSNIWLTEWTSDPELQNLTALPANSTDRRNKNDLYMGVFGAFTVGQAVFILLYLTVQCVRLIQAARVLHHNMLVNILRGPMSFFDTTPVGRILNRFSQDVESIDSEIPHTLEQFLDCLFILLSILIVISYSTPIFLVIILPVGFLYVLVQRYYIPTSRQLRRLESKTRSPIYNNFSESLTGASIIRAFRVEERFIKESEHRVDHNQKFGYANYAVNRWLGFRLETMGACIVLAAALFAVIDRKSITGALVGLSVSYALQITDNLNWFVRMVSQLETNIVSVERVEQYSSTPQEAPLYTDRNPDPSWPDHGQVDIQNLSVRYREGLDMVLKDVNMALKPGEKVGIVGRTGAGKSSLTLSLFRLIESAAGRITIDGEDIKQLGLADLRSRLTILPQEPVMFSGSLRLNLDPLDSYSDAMIWRALDHAHLKTFVEGLNTQLLYEVGEGGQNLSVGQKQLMCLARSLLRKTKILVLDEATAAVDLETDEVIQDTIRREFADCTVLTIAHRLNTVMDYDRILVLSEGRVQEFDAPSVLLQNRDSLFYAMAKDAGLV